MSEEEIIKYLDSYKNWQCDLREYQSCIECENKTKQAIQGLLDLYNKEKEKNKELIEGQIKTLEKILLPQLLKKYVSKDKIKEKIEILEKCTTKIDKKVNLTDYMIIGETERAVGRFVNLDFIKKVLLDEPGYNIELLDKE